MVPRDSVGLLPRSFMWGKLRAPPAISDLNSQILRLRKAEANLSTSFSKVSTRSPGYDMVPMVDDLDVQAASAAYSEYLAQ